MKCHAWSRIGGRKIYRTGKREAACHAAEVGLLDLERVPDRIDLHTHRDAVDDQWRIARAVGGSEHDDAARDDEGPRRTRPRRRVELREEADAARSGFRVERKLELARGRIPAQVQLAFVDVDAALGIAARTEVAGACHGLTAFPPSAIETVDGNGLGLAGLADSLLQLRKS